jgi:lipoprotein-anchoring transpeptidase ErfK/SrfK
MPEPARSHDDLLKQVRQTPLACDDVPVARPLIFIDSQKQRLWQLAPNDAASRCYPVSTSRHGLGTQKDSYQTPQGIHRITHKIGDGEPLGCVFKSRIASAEICLQQTDGTQQDVITSRILRLEGLQPGINRGGDVDSFERYIYIHGTADEAHIGQPASIGCIRMKNADVIDLFERVEPGDLVVIV